jgi:hypothetical protein
LLVRHDAAQKGNLNEAEINVDSTVPYKLDRFVYHVENGTNKSTQASKQESWISILHKIEVLKNDSRLTLGNVLYRTWKNRSQQSVSPGMRPLNSSRMPVLSSQMLWLPGGRGRYRVIAEELEHQGVTDRAILAQRATTMQAVGMKDDEVAWLRRVGKDGPRVWVGLSLAFDVGKRSPVAPVERLGRVVGVIIGAAIILRPVM